MADVLVLKARDLTHDWRLPDGVRAAIIMGDSVHSVLPMLAPGSIDGTITDPPYSSGGAFRGDRNVSTAVKYLTNESTNAAGNLPDFFGDTRDGLAHLFWLQTALANCWAVTRDRGFVAMFSDWRQVPAAALALQGAGWSWRGMRPMIKHPGYYRQLYHYPHPDAEYCLWGTRGPMETPNPVPVVQPPAPWMAKTPKGAEKRHQTEKPLQIMRDLVRVVQPGGIVLDPFAGSGTTLEAALIEGRRAIGVELSKDYAQVIAERLSAVEVGAEPHVQTALFGGARG